MTPEQGKAFRKYLKNLKSECEKGDAVEETHRRSLADLLETLFPVIKCQIGLKKAEGQHIIPDIEVQQGIIKLGIIETKDVGLSLDKAINTPQLQKYLKLPNWILTNFYEFRWYINGNKHLSVSLTDKPNIETEELLYSLFSGFITCDIQTISDAKDFSNRLASLARILRKLIHTEYQLETEDGELHAQLKSFKEILIFDLDLERFSDMYAQTICYGLFAARCNSEAKMFSRQTAVEHIPKTNPFLRNLFHQMLSPDIDSKIIEAVDQIVKLLNKTNFNEVLKGFGKHTKKEDPVIHFYETFLQEYSPKTREERGVYFTPDPIVSYIVRSVDTILKQSFNKSDGVADPTVLLLDPACGTGTFLYTTMKMIHDNVVSKGQEGNWSNYVRDSLMTKLFGFEILMAPYAVSHMSLGLFLKETGYDFKGNDRLRIYLTNTLEEGEKKTEVVFSKHVSEEANAASEIKKDKPILVVLGNPPYLGHSKNKGRWIKQLIEQYKLGYPDLQKRGKAKWLQNDYVKFLSFGQWRVNLSDQGILAFVTPNAYLDNLTFKGMRKSFKDSFNDLYLLNLHGNVQKKDVSPDGTKDENVFNIEIGISIGIFVKQKGNKSTGNIHYAEVWGTNEHKFKLLYEKTVQSIEWITLNPKEPDVFFIPRNNPLEDEYNHYWSLADIFNQNGDPAPGLVTTHDDFAISFTKDDVIRKVVSFLDTSSEKEARELFSLCGQDQWNYEQAKKVLATNLWRKSIVPIYHRPFDIRWTVYDSNVAVHRRERVMNHMFKENIALICPHRVETSGPWQHIICSENIVDHVAVSSKTIDTVFPLFLYPQQQGQLNIIDNKQARTININPLFIEAIDTKYHTKYKLQTETDDIKDVVYYIYAILFSKQYRDRYDDFLKYDYPKIPLVEDKDCFDNLVALGKEMVNLHLFKSSLSTISTFPVQGENIINTVTYQDNKVCINKEQYFGNVSPEVWNFKVGGYMVCKWWLADRKKKLKGIPLSASDISHYQRIIATIRETLRIMKDIDKTIVLPV